MTVNVPLLRKAVEWAETEATIPEIDREWAQDVWHHSAANKARDLAYTFLCDMTSKERTPGEQLDIRQVSSRLEPMCKTSYCIAGWICHEAGIAPTTVDERDEFDWVENANRLLGIDRAYGLYSGGNSIEAIRFIAEYIAGEPL